MNCKKCGSPLLPNETYCQKCGEKVENVVSNEVQAAVQPEVAQQPVTQNVQQVPVSAPVQPSVTPNVAPQSQVNVQQPVQTQVVADPYVGGVVPPVQPSVQPIQNDNQKTKNNKLTIIIIIVLIVLAVIAIAVYVVMDLNSSDESSTKKNITTTEEVVTTTEEVEETTTTTKVSGKDAIISYGGYSFSIPSDEYTSWTKNDYLCIGNNSSSIYAVFSKIYSNLTIDSFINDSEALKTQLGATDYTSGTISSTTVLLFETSNYTIMLANLPDGSVIQFTIMGYSSANSDEDYTNFMSDLVTTIESATSDGTGTFNSSTIDDIEVDDSILN